MVISYYLLEKVNECSKNISLKNIFFNFFNGKKVINGFKKEKKLLIFLMTFVNFSRKYCKNFF